MITLVSSTIRVLSLRLYLCEPYKRILGFGRPLALVQQQRGKALRSELKGELT